MRVIIISVMTVCGKITPVSGLGSPLDRQYLGLMRELTSCSLIGAGTLREGNPEMRIRDGTIPRNRIRAIITLSGNIPFQDKRIFQTEPIPIIFAPTDRVEYLRKTLGKRASVIGLSYGKDGLSLTEMQSVLKNYGVNSILIEGGGKLNYSALSQGIVDEVHVTVAPKILGDSQSHSIFHGNAPLGHPFVNLELFAHEVWQTGEILLKYRVSKRVIH